MTLAQAAEIKFRDMQANAVEASTLLKSMSNEHRLLILCQLVEGEKSVSALQANLPLSQSALSQHLAVLRRDGLVRTRRVAQSVLYSLDSEEAQALLAALYDVYCAPDKG